MINITAAWSFCGISANDSISSGVVDGRNILSWDKQNGLEFEFSLETKEISLEINKITKKCAQNSNQSYEIIFRARNNERTRTPFVRWALYTHRRQQKFTSLDNKNTLFTKKKTDNIILMNDVICLMYWKTCNYKLALNICNSTRSSNWNFVVIRRFLLASSDFLISEPFRHHRDWFGLLWLFLSIWHYWVYFTNGAI